MLLLWKSLKPGCNLKINHIYVTRVLLFFCDWDCVLKTDSGRGFLQVDKMR